MKLKKLNEQRAELLKNIEIENASETRSAEKLKDLLDQLDAKNEEIKLEKRLLNSKTFKNVEKNTEKRDFNAEIRAAIQNGKELDITNFEVRGIGVGEEQGEVTSTTMPIAKTTFANAILKKATETSDLYNYVRKENFGAATHQIPVQADKLGKFENVKELADYTSKEVNFKPINMAAHKYGAITIVSEECLSDTGYPIMQELLEQYGEGAGLKLDELLVNGDDTNNVEGLKSFIQAGSTNPTDADTKVVTVDDATSKDQEGLLAKLMETYNALPRKYAKNAVWVISPGIAGVLNTAVDSIGRPLLYQDFSGVPFGGQVTPMLLGRPVVISDEIKDVATAAANDPIVYFGDLSKALICGIRQNFTIKTSTEYGFINDGIAVKGTMRLDVKRGVTEAMAVLVRE